MLRARRYYSATGLIHLYKAKILSYAEYRTAAVFHACDSHLHGLDRVQTRFLEEIGVDPLTAFTVFNLAPLQARRNIAMLGLIHRAVLGQGPVHFQSFFKLDGTALRRSGRFQRHPLQIREYRDGTQLEIVKRSCLGLASVYNLLPSECVGHSDVKGFQRSLHDHLRDCAQRGLEQWELLHCPRLPIHNHPLRRF